MPTKPTMRTKQLQIADVVLLTPVQNTDNRGFFSETYNRKIFEELGIHANFVQDNHSSSNQAFVLRGLHFQKPPTDQGKLIRVTQGSILDVALDIRQNSPTYGKHVSAILSAKNWHQLWIPSGFAHGFCTLEENTQVQYKVTNYYSRENECGIAYNDPALSIDWNLPAGVKPVLSERDKNHRNFAQLPGYFTYQPNENKS